VTFSEFLQKAKRILHLSKKPSRKELRYGIRMNLLAIVGLGIIGFIVRIIFFVLLGI
jgi:protein translocase SEC61 complex gamma subunit